LKTSKAKRNVGHEILEGLRGDTGGASPCTLFKAGRCKCSGWMSSLALRNFKR